MCFSTPWIFPKRHQPFPKSPLFWFSKIHILKLWTSPKDSQPLVSKTLKVPSFGFHEIRQAYPTNGSWSAKIMFQICQNYVTVAKIVSRFIVYDPRYTNLIHKLCHVFPNRVTIWPQEQPCIRHQKSWHGCQIVSRLNFFQNHFWVTSQHTYF